MATEYIPVTDDDGNEFEVAMEQVGSDGEVQRLAQHVVLYSDAAVVSTANPLATVGHRAPTAVVTSVDASDTAVQLMADNDHRHGVLLHNMSDSPVYIKCGPDATLDLFSFMLDSNETYEPNGPTVYLGIYSAVWETGSTGMLMVTEFE